MSVSRETLTTHTHTHTHIMINHQTNISPAEVPAHIAFVVFAGIVEPIGPYMVDHILTRTAHMVGVSHVTPWDDDEATD